MKIQAAIASVLPILWLGPGAAAAQQDGEAGASDSGPGVEEVIVRGRRYGALRHQIELAEEAVYDRFNAINSNDEFDIHCYHEPITGSRIPRRTCRANFWRKAESRAGSETSRAIRGEYAIASSTFLGEAQYKSHLLADEMRRLAAEDDQLIGALTRLAQLQQAASDPAAAPASPDSTASRDVAAVDGELPYDAASVADVRIGPEPWSHELMRRTFSIANLYGEITSLRLDCAEASGPLRYELGAEWTIPEGWSSCSLEVAAPSGTYFSFYEFD